MTGGGPCKDCEMRCVGCHGKDRDGTWRCRKWGEYQDMLAEEQQRTSQERLEAIVGRDYTRESRIRFSRKKVNGHY